MPQTSAHRNRLNGHAPARTRVTLACGLLVAGPVLAQAPPAEGGAATMPRLRMSTLLAPEPSASAPGATVVRARSLRAKVDDSLQAEGDVELRRSGLVLRADTLVYNAATDLARAQGHVEVQRGGSRFSGPEAEVTLRNFEGHVLQPQYRFAGTGAGGSAQRIDFASATRMTATAATYTSCLADGTGLPDWVLSADRVRLDFDANEGIADGAVLRFMGVPLLALPSMSFPITGARKSGWLAPSVDLDTRSGLGLTVPYYWNIAPNLDATLSPKVITRRGAGGLGELRYLREEFAGMVQADVLAHDALAGRSRRSLYWTHDSDVAQPLRVTALAERVSDTDWWKDFPRAHHQFTPRLLPTQVRAERQWQWNGSAIDTYAMWQQWQVLRSDDNPMLAPYQRTPQIGLRTSRPVGGGWEWQLQTEVNRFTLDDPKAAPTLPNGWRWHALGAVTRPQHEDGWWLVPRLQLNAASYRTEWPSSGAVSRSRVIPTFSLDSGLELERSSTFLGKAYVQTLEPRLFYVNTPYREQGSLPNYDAAGKDFNLSSIYSDNAFSGVDRVADAHQLTAGFTSRWLQRDTGVEALRLSVVQRYLLRDQLITPDGEPLTRRFSDVLLLGSTTLLAPWKLDAALQYGADINRPVRSVVGVRYSPGPYRTFNASYRLSRGLSEQLDMGWQWPVFSGQAAGPGGCNGTLYSVGRLNYSLRDDRVTDSLAGLEYDAGCWIARVVAERVAVGSSGATTRVHLQLELTGLSRLGSNPLRALKDNIPGYKLLREDERGGSSAAAWND